MRKLLSILVILSLVVFIPNVFAQVTVGSPAFQELVEVTINKDGSAHVKHVLKETSTPVQVELISGERSNLTVKTEDGKEKNHGVVGENGIAIFSSPKKVVIEYDLSDFMQLDNKMWHVDFLYLESTSFIFPEGINQIFVNESPVFLGDRKGISCHGCQMKLEYSFEDPTDFQKISWEDKEFVVEIKTMGKINQLNFDQLGKNLSFDVDGNGSYITTIIPLELLWEPYQVFLDDEKIEFHTFRNNSTHVWLNFKPESAGQISIVGTTVVPEFPLVLLILSVSVFAIIPITRKFNLH